MDVKQLFFVATVNRRLLTDKPTDRDKKHYTAETDHVVEERLSSVFWHRLSRAVLKKKTATVLSADITALARKNVNYNLINSKHYTAETDNIMEGTCPHRGSRTSTDTSRRLCVELRRGSGTSLRAFHTAAPDSLS